MLKNKSEQLSRFGPIWSEFKLGQRLRQKEETDFVMFPSRIFVGTYCLILASNRKYG